jgi:hypothetical protein
MSSAIVIRVFAAAGIPAPASVAVARALGRCPRDRLVRVVSWYAWEHCRGAPSEQLSEGIRLLMRGWDDFYTTITLPSGAALVNVEGPALQGTALVTRRERIGRGWYKESVSTIGGVRSEVELAARWLQGIVGCIVHDDCAANPELGLACAMSVER